MSTLATLSSSPTSPEALVQYLELAGWVEQADAPRRWRVFVGGADADGNPLEIALPRNPSARDYSTYQQLALELLAALGDEHTEMMAQRVRNFDRDVLYVINPDPDNLGSLQLGFAVKQMAQLKSMVAYSASSERDPRPFFDRALSVGQKMARDHYRFGHTVKGSFGFTVESRLTSTSTRYLGEERVATQMALEYAASAEIVVPPLERLVMERIVRGLQKTRDATDKLAPGMLVDGYEEGFNANACTAVIGVARKKVSRVNYQVLWSPKLRAPDDVSSSDIVSLGSRSYEYLEEAAQTLRKVSPQRTRVKGVIVALRASDNPLGTETRRSVVIRWIRPEQRDRNLVVSLRREDYVLAIRAHREWKSVALTGIVQRSGSVWRLYEPREFEATF